MPCEHCFCDACAGYDAVIAARGAELIKKAKLSPCESRVICDAIEGLKIDEMTARHSRSRNTIKTQIRYVLRKTGFDSIAQIISYLRRR